jgi:type 2 lantibiotic biosynthesis protein LanM
VAVSRSGRDVPTLSRAGRLPRRFTARAASLEELIRLAPGSAASPRDRERARADLGRFFTGENRAIFDQFLSLTDISEDEILAALSSRVLDSSALRDARWYRLLAEILSSGFLASCDAAIAGAGGLRKPLYPFLNWAGARIDEWSAVHDAEWGSLRASLLEQLSDQLIELTYKTFVLEANILSGTSGGGEEGGSSAVDRFARAAAERPRCVQRLYLRYPALARLAAAAVLQWRKNTEDVLVRLRADASKIEESILRGPIGVLQGIAGTLSDPHDGGKRVLVLRFSSGRRLVYKPRSADVDLAYQRLIAWLNGAGVEPPLRVLGVVTGDKYGWCEFVEAGALSGEEDARRFYRRHGAHLAVLYLLKATDFHSENVIASGEHPVLIDLETLMHADVKGAPDKEPPSGGDRALRNSVFASGLLPGWTDGDPLSPSPDLSGIGAREGQFHKNMGDVIKRGGDGAISVVREKIGVAAHANLPSRDGSRINPALFGDEVVRGFDACFRALRANAAALSAADGPLSALRKAEVRHVALATSVYGGLLRRATHPDFLARSAHRELVFASLAQISRVLPPSGLLLRSELRALFNGDVPRFTGFAETASLFDEGGAELSGFLREPAATGVQMRVKDLTERNETLQKEIIRLSMATLRRRGEPGTEPAARHPVAASALKDDEVLGEIRGIADALCDRAIMAGDQIDWIGLTQVDYGRSRVSPAGADLYDGISGIGLFLGYAGAKLDCDRFSSTARSCGRAALGALRREPAFAGGAFNGQVSVAYGLLHIAAALKEESWQDEAVEALMRLSKDAEKDDLLDIIAGSAGACGVLLAAHALRPDARLVDAAVRRAEHLLAKRVELASGHGWPSRNSSAPLTGFSHGAAGIGWALMRVGHLANREDFVAGGIKAFEYERSLYRGESASWPDFREAAAPEASADYSTAWCHGGPGIGLSRATLPAGRVGAAELLEIENALKSTRDVELSPTDCLCHGELGNVDLLLAAAGPARQPHLRALAKRRASGALARRRARGAWRCGSVPDEPVPGLLIGLAGIGYGLLRCYFPDEAPSILALAPPRGSRA